VCLATPRAAGEHRGMLLRYRILNVFTVDDRLSGNPLCVFEASDAVAALSTEQMQALARQLNLSETTFVLPSTVATARVRIFTPGFEMPFAGHPTLGTAHVVRALWGGDHITLEENVGIVPVTADGDRWTLRAAKGPVTRAPTATRAQLAQMLGLREAAIGEPLWIDTGAEQLVIPLASVADVRDATPVASLFAQYARGHDEEMTYVWARDQGDRIVVRFFFTQHGAVIEDPATGSACANLGGYLLATGAALPLAATLSQGEAVHRPSRLGLRIDADRGIHVSGNVVELGAGVFDV
jgi:trans-2,3-dihydro-3-hydroxyanthranilate isomerase